MSDTVLLIVIIVLFALGLGLLWQETSKAFEEWRKG